METVLPSRLFLRGPAGFGKTTAAVARMKYLLEKEIPADQILVLTPQRTLQSPYLEIIHSPDLAAGGELTPATIGGLARRILDLFWPLAAEITGFAQPNKPPVFLTLETAQYYMASLVRPHLEEGWFDSVVLDRNRLCSQILDNLNKSAMIGFPHEEIGQRLSSAWTGEPAQHRVYADAQACATEFRRYCFENNLLDFSLQLEIFSKVLWNDFTIRNYLLRSYRHIIYDNIEEDIPVAHDIMSEWLQECDSALLVFDEDAGYRKFLGADPDSAIELEKICDKSYTFTESFITNRNINYLSHSLTKAIAPTKPSGLINIERQEIDSILTIVTSRFFPEMLDKIADEIKRLVVNEKIPPSEIVVLAPYLSDSLRFSLISRLETRGIPFQTYRPSRSLRDEPTTHCLLTLAALAHPSWGINPTKFDFAYALLQVIENLDLVRAQLLTEVIYRAKDLTLFPFEQIRPEMQERITYLVGSRYSQLRNWIETYRSSNPLPLDHFLRELFGEILSQPGFGFRQSFDAARIAANLIESIQKFRWAIEPHLDPSQHFEIGKEYLTLLNDGVIAAQFVTGWSHALEEAVLLAPAHTFLMSNRPVLIQFWLDVGSMGWFERLFQPLTHPYVLSRSWKPGAKWTDANENEANSEALERLLHGLLLRCRGQIFLGLTDLSESGYEQRGVLIRAFQHILQNK